MEPMTLEQAENYPGELAALRALLGEVRAFARYGDLTELRRTLDQYDRDASDAFAASVGNKSEQK